MAMNANTKTDSTSRPTVKVLGTFQNLAASVATVTARSSGSAHGIPSRMVRDAEGFFRGLGRARLALGGGAVERPGDQVVAPGLDDLARDHVAGGQSRRWTSVTPSTSGASA